MNGIERRGQDIAFSLCWSFLTFFLCPYMGPLWAAIPSGVFLLCCGVSHSYSLIIFVVPSSSLHSLILSMFPPPHFLLHFHRGIINFVDWLSSILWWVCCRVSGNQMCLAWGSPWSLSQKPPLSPSATKPLPFTPSVTANPEKNNLSKQVGIKGQSMSKSM